MAPINIDGNQVSSVTIDGTEVSEITVDGNVVFSASAIPDSVSYWNMNNLSGTSIGDTIFDENGNHDLTIDGDNGVSIVSSFDSEYDNAIEHQALSGERAYLYNDNIGSGWLNSHTVAFFWNPGNPMSTGSSNSGLYKFETDIGDYSGYADGFGIQFSQTPTDNNGELLDYSIVHSGGSRGEFSTSSGPLNGEDNWYWVVSRFDDGSRFNYRVYEYGVGLIGEHDDTSGFTIQNSGDVTLVMYGGISSEDIFGYFDETRIWKSFLSDQEIDDIWNNAYNV